MGRARTILVVDDVSGIREIVRIILEDHGQRVLEAETGDEALAMMAALAGEVGLLFSDIMMPGNLNGLELADHVRARWPAVPILLTTGFFAGQHFDGKLRYPVLKKPYRAAELISYVERLIDEQEDYRASVDAA